LVNEPAASPLVADESAPLATVRVVDLTTTLAGPSATRMLADFGADVIKIESRAHPDPLRLGPPFAAGRAGPDTSGYFAMYNAGKRSFALDLTHPRAVEVMADLVRASDVLVESFTPGVLERRGLPPAVLHEWNPSLVVARHSLNGQTGRWASAKGFGHLASAQTGWTGLTGERGSTPCGPFSAYTDFVSWPYLVVAILLALEHRDATGCGTVIDQSHIESSTYFLAPELVAAQRGTAPVACGNDESYACPSGVYPCAGIDEWCAITVTSDEAWVVFCEVVGADLSSGHEWATLAERIADRRAVDDAVGAATRWWDGEELVGALQTHDIAAARLARAGDLARDQELARRGALRSLSKAPIGDHLVHGPGFRIDGVASGPDRAYPWLGEHTEVVCREVLGYDDEKLSGLVGEGVFR